MVSLFEIVAQKKLLDLKIKELEEELKIKQTEVLAEEFFVLLELRQGKLLNIDAANNASHIKIGETEVSIATAVRLRDTIKAKIDLLTSLIRDENCSLDIVDLQSQRDKFYDEFLLLTMAINRNDFQVTIG